MLIVVMLLAACGGVSPSTPETTSTATLPPSDSEAEPTEDVTITARLLLVANPPAQTDSLVEGLNRDEELAVALDFTDSYAEALTALCAGQAQVVSLDAFGYLAARAQSCGEALYVMEVDGATETQGQILADSWTGIYAIEGALGRTFCRADAFSLTGWIIPSITMRARGVDPLSDLAGVRDAGDEETVVRMIADGTCAIGATSLGAEAEVTDLETPGRVAFVEELTPVPNDVVVLSTRLDEPTRAILMDLLRQQRDELAAALGADSLSGIADDAFDNLAALLSDAGIDPAAMGQ